jgi:hypothetical protein
MTTAIVIGKPIIDEKAYFGSEEITYTNERYLPRILLEANIISCYKEAIDANLNYSLDCIGIKLIKYRNRTIELMVGAKDNENYSNT